MRRRPSMNGVLHGLMRAPGMSRPELIAHQSRLLRRLVLHAFENVPFYRRLFDRHRVRPRDIDGVGDLTRIPIIERSDLRRYPASDLVAAGIDPEALISRRTSGSSGEPFPIRRTWLEQNQLHLFRLRAHRSVGLRLTDRIASIGVPPRIHPRDSKLLGRILRGFGIFRRTPIDMYQDPGEILAQIAALRPECISAYPGVLARVADLVPDSSSFVAPRLLLTGAEMLTPPLRRRIERGFGARVYDFFGCHEINLVAWECAASDHVLHTCDDAAIVEVIRDGQPVAEGEIGEVVITGLHSYAMPFLRYRLTDLAVRGPSSCVCGQPFGTLERIVGRTFDDFLLGGRWVHPQEIGSKLVTDATWIGQYQLIQEREDRIVLRVIPDRRTSAPDLDPLRSEAARILGPEIEFEVVVTDDLPREPNGKFRVFKSYVTSGP